MKTLRTAWVCDPFDPERKFSWKVVGEDPIDWDEIAQAAKDSAAIPKDEWDSHNFTKKWIDYIPADNEGFIDGEKAAGNESMTDEECEMVEDKMDELNEKFANLTEIPRLLCGLTLYGGFSVHYDFSEIYDCTEVPFGEGQDYAIDEAVDFIESCLDEAITEAA